MSAEQETMNLVLANFDPDVFLQSEFEQVPDTTRTLIPQAWMKVSTIKDIEFIKPKQYTNESSGEKFWTSPVFVPHMLIEDEGVREELNIRDDRELFFRPKLYIDLTPEGALDFGTNRNIKLGQLVAATGLSEGGVPWSFPMFRGCRGFNIKVTHRAAKNNPDLVFEELAEVAPLTEEQLAA